MESKTVQVPSIHCGHCVMTIQRELGDVAGIKSVKADDKAKTVTVDWEAPADWEKIKTALAELGYPVA